MHIINGYLAIAAEKVCLVGLLVFLVSLGLRASDRFAGVMAGLSLMATYAYLVMSVDPNLRDPVLIEQSRSILISMTKVYIFLVFMNIVGACCWCYALYRVGSSDGTARNKTIHLLVTLFLATTVALLYHYYGLFTAAIAQPIFAFGFHQAGMHFVRKTEAWMAERKGR